MATTALSNLKHESAFGVADFPGTELKFGVVIAESDSQQKPLVLTDHARSAFKTLPLAIGICCACLLAK